MSSEENKKVPSWDGDPDKFEEYRMRAELYVDGLDHRNRPYGASRLIANLRGAAWETMREVSREERKKLRGDDGVELLLRYLEESVLDLPIPEAGKRLKNFLFGQKRLPGESMKIYASKNRTALMKLEEAIQKVEKRDRPKIVLETGDDHHPEHEPARPNARGDGTPEVMSDAGDEGENRSEPQDDASRQWNHYGGWTG
eukprot:4682638-Lingulodinium_polyedra.AAC.1